MFNRLTTILVLGVAVLGLAATGETPAHADQHQTFINELKTPVLKASQENHLFPSVMMAQAAIESDWGTSTLATQANNYFGIKGTYNGQSVIMPTMEVGASGKAFSTMAQFRKYPSVTASVDDNAAILRSGTSWDTALYASSWQENAGSYEDAADGLALKYATNPHYGTQLKQVIQQYHLHQLLDLAPKTQAQKAKAAVTAHPKKTTVTKVNTSGVVRPTKQRIYSQVPTKKNHPQTQSSTSFTNHSVTIDRVMHTAAGAVWYHINDNGNTGWVAKSGLYPL